MERTTYVDTPSTCWSPVPGNMLQVSFLNKAIFSSQGTRYPYSFWHKRNNVSLFVSDRGVCIRNSNFSKWLGYYACEVMSFWTPRLWEKRLPTGRKKDKPHPISPQSLPSHALRTSVTMQMVPASHVCMAWHTWLPECTPDTLCCKMLGCHLSHLKSKDQGVN